MCTVTWLRRPGGYELFFSRDELKTRQPAIPPAGRTLRGVRYVAPRDGDFGGTWLGVNEHGVTVGLLNGRGAPPPEPRRSRGTIVAALVDATSARAAVDRLERMRLGDVAPFLLVALGPDEVAQAAEWDGQALLAGAFADSRLPLTSSSLDPEGVAIARKNLLEVASGRADRFDVDLLDRFHRSHEPERGPLSVCMHRDDAETVSLCRVSVTPALVELHYEAGSPCSRPQPIVARMRRRRSPEAPRGGARP
jgi:hypothetical protein